MRHHDHVWTHSCSIVCGLPFYTYDFLPWSSASNFQVHKYPTINKLGKHNPSNLRHYKSLKLTCILFAAIKLAQLSESQKYRHSTSSIINFTQNMFINFFAAFSISNVRHNEETKHYTSTVGRLHSLDIQKCCIDCWEKLATNSNNTVCSPAYF